MPATATATATFRNKRTGEVKDFTLEEAISVGIPQEKFLQKLKTRKEIEDIGRPPEEEEKPLPATSAKLVGSVKSGLTSIGRIKDILDVDKEKEGFESGGLALFGARTPLTPWGRGLEADLYNLADAVLRLRTGAAAPETEVRRFMKTIAPSPLDSPKVKQQKIETAELELRQVATSLGIDPDELLGKKQVPGDAVDLATAEKVEGVTPGVVEEVPPAREAADEALREPERNPIVNFFLGAALDLAQDVGVGLGLRGKEGEELAKSQEQAVEAANRAFDKALKTDDPEQSEKLFQVAEDTLNQVGLNTQNMEDLFSESIEEPALLRGVVTGAEIAGMAEIPALVKGGVSLLKAGGKKLLQRGGKEVAEEAVEQATKRGAKSKIVKIGEAIEKRLPGRVLSDAQQKAAEILSKVKINPQPILDVGEAMVKKVPALEKTMSKYRTLISGAKNPEDLLQVLDFLGDAFTQSQRTGKGLNPKLLKTMYKEALNILKTSAPAVYENRALLRFTINLPKTVAKTLWRATIGRAAVGGL